MANRRANKSADTDGMLQELHDRIVSIEHRLYGNGDSLIERLTRLEAKQEQLFAMMNESHRELVEKTSIALQKRVVELLDTQVSVQLRSSRHQILGLWITIALTIIGLILSKMLSGGI